MKIVIRKTHIQAKNWGHIRQFRIDRGEFSFVASKRVGCYPDVTIWVDSRYWSVVFTPLPKLSSGYIPF